MCTSDPSQISFFSFCPNVYSPFSVLRSDPHNVRSANPGVGSAVRDISVYFRGAVVGSDKAGPFAKGYSSGSRQHVLENFGASQGWLISSENQQDLYHTELSRSRLCLAPSGWELWSVRLYEALLLGCVPVIMSDGLELPFQSRVDYSKMTVRVLESDVKRLPELLSGLSDRDIAEKRTSIQKMWKAVTFQRPPQEGDAWHLLMGELAERAPKKGGTPGGAWL
jgi:hypothetical protein